MSRLPYAAKKLLEQVQAHDPEAEATFGDPDGLGVIRDVRFSSKVAKWLGPILEANPDERIARVKRNRNGLLVTFSAGPNADLRHSFPIPAPEAS